MNRSPHILVAAALVILSAWAAPARAVLTIEIVNGVEGALPIAVVPFAWQGEGPAPDTDVAGVVRDDLHRSGQFETLAVSDMVERPDTQDAVNFGTWRLLKMDYLVIGRLMPAGNGYRAEFELYNTHSQKRLTGYGINASAGDLRALSHHISDLIYKELLGVEGAFSTRIAYITAEGAGDDRSFALHVADADGYNPQTIVRSAKPLLSPAWSPDGKKLAYVSFESGNSSVFVQDLASGQRRRIASFKGINGAPDFSPDGTRLALALSKAGSPDIYVLDLDSGNLRRLTDHWAIDTEPRWMPDGRSLVFTSDRGGRPQLYTLNATTGATERLTYDGDYNAGASVGPRGRLVAMVHGRNNDFRIAVLDRQNSVVKVLSDGPLDESPSFAPNGSMILYATQYGGHGTLAAVSADGRVHQRLSVSEGDVREPAWSPILSR